MNNILIDCGVAVCRSIWLCRVCICVMHVLQLHTKCEEVSYKVRSRPFLHFHTTHCCSTTNTCMLAKMQIARCRKANYEWICEMSHTSIKLDFLEDSIRYRKTSPMNAFDRLGNIEDSPISVLDIKKILWVNFWSKFRQFEPLNLSAMHRLDDCWPNVSNRTMTVLVCSNNIWNNVLSSFGKSYSPALLAWSQSSRIYSRCLGPFAFFLPYFTRNY